MSKNTGLVSIINNIRKIRKVFPTREKDDLFVVCKECKEMITREDYLKNSNVCPGCNDHGDITPNERLDNLMDSYRFVHSRYRFKNPLNYDEYKDIHRRNQRESDSQEAVVVAHGKIDGINAVVGVLDKKFMMGSMGTYVGEEITKAFDLGRKRNMPVIIYSASGGARMQEGIFSLMQMAKTSIAVKEFLDSGNLFVSVMTHPTTGGVTASFASLGDINIAEPGALIGFAGPRVIEQTIGESLPEGFQRAEFLEEKGQLDDIVSRNSHREYISKVLKLHNYR